VLSEIVILTALLGLPTNEFKLGIVDLNRALNTVEEGKAARVKLEKEAADKKAEMDKRQKELEGLEKELQDLGRKAQSLPLSDAEKKRGMELQQKYGKLFQDGAELSKKYNDEMTEKKYKLEQEIIRKARVIVEDMSRTGTYNLVLDKNESGLIYAAQADDLTERLIQKYNGENKAGAKK